MKNHKLFVSLSDTNSNNSESSFGLSTIVAFLQRTVNITPKNQTISLCFFSLALLFSVHNLIAPNMTQIASLFHFSPIEKDELIGGELTLAFYAPGIIVALVFGGLTLVCLRKNLFLSILICTSLSCGATWWVTRWNQLVLCRIFTGMGIGGALPVVYSMIGDWYSTSDDRARASALATAACGFGVFGGQAIAAVLGSWDWRAPFLVVAIPSLFLSIVWYLYATEPAVSKPFESSVASDRADPESIRSSAGFEYTLSSRHLKSVCSRTNLCVMLQAFPGNIPWGIIIVYLHDFLTTDLHFDLKHTLFAVGVIAVSGFVGVILGGNVGSVLSRVDRSPRSASPGSILKRRFVIFVAVMSVVRVVPFFMIFGWSNTRLVHTPTPSSSLESRAHHELGSLLQFSESRYPEMGHSLQKSEMGHTRLQSASVASKIASTPLSNSSVMHSQVKDLRLLPENSVNVQKLSAPISINMNSSPKGFGQSQINVSRIPVQNTSANVTKAALLKFPDANFEGVADTLSHPANTAQEVISHGTIYGIPLSFYLLLILAGLCSTLPSPSLGAILLDVNLPQLRGSVFAVYSVLDDISKAAGTLFVGLLVKVMGQRAVAFQIALFIWVLCGCALFMIIYEYEKDEERMLALSSDIHIERVVADTKAVAIREISKRSKIAARSLRCPP